VGSKQEIIQLIKIGNSTGIIIKKKVLQSAGIQENTSLYISVENGKIVISPLKIQVR